VSDVRIDSVQVAYNLGGVQQASSVCAALPASAGKGRISTFEGEQPRWGGDGKELFYIGLDRKLMAVEVKSRIPRRSTSC
jgi:hypothetical protein